MNTASLTERAETFLRSALERTGRYPRLAALHNELRHALERLHQPMRVAIVGLIKAGKSTMVNALLGEAVVATGTVETTFNINWLRYGEALSLRVHYKDGRAPEARALGELDVLTRRAHEHQALLNSLAYIEVFYPNPVLQSFDLIDTPGLASFYQDDSENTLRFLNLHGRELTETTQAEASHADAILYLFSQNISASDQSLVEAFHGPVLARATPINAIGVLSRVDSFWPAREDPLLAGREIASRLAAHPQVRRVFYTVYPLCGLLAFGAQILTDEDVQVCKQLAALPEERCTRLVSDMRRLCERDYEDVPVPAARRRQLAAQLGPYGIWLACTLIRRGVLEQKPLKQALLDRSGLPELRDTLRSHFGNRAFLIKLHTALQRLKAACFAAERQHGGVEQQIASGIAGEIDAIEAQEHAFAELRVLRNYYESKLQLTRQEADHLLQVTGEFGRSLGERLGLPQGERATVAEMRPIATERLRYWQRKAVDFTLDRTIIEAASVLVRSYERILHHLDQVECYLYP